MKEKRPRTYASEICDLTSREERKQALAGVPEKYREMVKRYVETWFLIKRGK